MTTAMPTVITTTVQETPTTISSEISVTSNSPEQGGFAGPRSSSDPASLIPTVITLTISGSKTALATSLPAATESNGAVGEQGGNPSGSTTSVFVTPMQSVVTVYVSGYATLSTSSSLVTKTTTLPDAGGFGGAEFSTLSVDPAGVPTPPQSVVTVTASGGLESLSTSSVLVATQTVFVTAGGDNTAIPQQATITVTETAVAAGGSGGSQCEATRTVTVCATGGVCPTGSVGGATRLQPLLRVRV